MSELSKTWRVKWFNPITGQTGAGKAAFYRYEAAIWADHYNKDPQWAPLRYGIEDTEDTEDTDVNKSTNPTNPTGEHR